MEDEFTLKQRQVALQFLRAKYEKLHTILLDRDILDEHPHFLVEVYRVHQSKKAMTLMQACGYLGSKHDATNRRHLQVAIESGLVALERHPYDSRKQLVIPTSKLLLYVQDLITEECHTIKKLTEDFNTSE